MTLTKHLILMSGVSMALAAIAQDTTAPAQTSGLTMPNSKPGECYALVMEPAKLSATNKEVLVKDAGEKLEMKPATYKWVEKQIEISSEVKTLEIVPATFKTIEEKVMVEPEKIEYEIMPAKFEEVTEEITIRPSIQVWKRGREGAIAAAGEVLRLVEAPEQKKKIVKRKMIEPPKVVKNVIPAIYKTVEKRVVDTPASTKEVIIPAEFKTVRVKELVEDAKEVRTPTPEAYETIAIQAVEKPAEMQWKRVLCESSANEANIIAMQKALASAGFDVDVDGKVGKGTLKALEEYQRQKGLAIGGITLESMKSLGVTVE